MVESLAMVEVQLNEVRFALTTFLLESCLLACFVHSL